MARVTVEDCIIKVPNRFELVLLASERTKALSSGTQPTISKSGDKNSVISLREIEEGTVSVEKLKDNLISSMQKYVKPQEKDSEEVALAEAEAELAADAEEFAYLSEAALANEADDVALAPEEES